MWPWRQAFLLIVGATVVVSLALWFWVPERTARPRGETFGEQVDGLMRLMRDAAFLRLAIHPTVLGAGLQIFSGLAKPLDLKLVAVEDFSGGIVVHTYHAA